MICTLLERHLLEQGNLLGQRSLYVGAEEVYENAVIAHVLHCERHLGVSAVGLEYLCRGLAAVLYEKVELLVMRCRDVVDRYHTAHVIGECACQFKQLYPLVALQYYGCRIVGHLKYLHNLRYGAEGVEVFNLRYLHCCLSLAHDSHITATFLKLLNQLQG